VLQALAVHINTDEPQFDSFGRVTLTVGGVPLLSVDTASNIATLDQLASKVSNPAYEPKEIPNPAFGAPGEPEFIANPFYNPDIPEYFITTTPVLDKMMEMIEMKNRLQSDVLTFDVGPAVSMAVTINGIDLAFFQGSDGKTRNIFNVLDDIYQAASSGAGAEELGRLIRPLQDAQNHLLTKVAELGGRTRRLDLLEARYAQDEINYEQMKSDAEDADFAEIILYQKMAEAVYQAALSAGARIIQPTLMDFLR